MLPCFFTSSWHRSPRTNTPTNHPPVSRGNCTTTHFFTTWKLPLFWGAYDFEFSEFPLSSRILTLLELTTVAPRPTGSQQLPPSYTMQRNSFASGNGGKKTSCNIKLLMNMEGKNSSLVAVGFGIGKPFRSKFNW